MVVPVSVPMTDLVSHLPLTRTLLLIPRYRRAYRDRVDATVFGQQQSAQLGLRPQPRRPEQRSHTRLAAEPHLLWNRSRHYPLSPARIIDQEECRIDGWLCIGSGKHGSEGGAACLVNVNPECARKNHFEVTPRGLAKTNCSECVSGTLWHHTGLNHSAFCILHLGLFSVPRLVGRQRSGRR